MERPITDFLLNLASDPQAHLDFVNDPDAVIREAGLTQEQHDILVSGDPLEVANAVRDEHADATEAFTHYEVFSGRVGLLISICRPDGAAD